MAGKEHTMNTRLASEKSAKQIAVMAEVLKKMTKAPENTPVEYAAMRMLVGEMAMVIGYQQHEMIQMRIEYLTDIRNLTEQTARIADALSR